MCECVGMCDMYVCICMCYDMYVCVSECVMRMCIIVCDIYVCVISMCSCMFRKDDNDSFGGQSRHAQQGLEENGLSLLMRPLCFLRRKLNSNMLTKVDSRASTLRFKSQLTVYYQLDLGK